MRALLLLVPALVSGCAGRARPARPTPVDERIAAGLDAVAYHGAASTSVAGLTLSRMDNGAVRASRAGAIERGRVASAGSRVLGARPARPPGEAGAPTARDDLRIEAAVRGALSTDALLAGMDLDVDVDHGVVRLSGDLATAEQAARALDIALDTPGVVAAESRCAWLSPTR